MLKNLILFPIRYYRRWRESRLLTEVKRVIDNATALDKLKMIEFNQSGVWIHVLDGRKFKWDAGTPNSLLTIPRAGGYEEKESRYIQELIKPGMTTFDCGANFGWYTTLLANCVGSAGTVHCFEPIPDVCDLLNENLRANMLHSRVHVNNCAIGDSEGKLSMLIPMRQGKGTPFASFKKQTWGKHRSVKARVTTLDMYCREKGLNCVNFIKCDVEGAEFLVIKGAEELFNLGNRPVIMLELVESSMRPFGFTRKEIYDFLGRFGYAPHYIDAEGKPVPITHASHIREQNVFFLPASLPDR